MLAITLFIIWLSKSWSGSVLNFKVLVSVWALDTQVSVWVLRHHSLGLGLEHQSLGLEEFSLKSKAALSCTFLDILHSITKRDMQFFFHWLSMDGACLNWQWISWAAKKFAGKIRENFHVHSFWFCLLAFFTRQAFLSAKSVCGAALWFILAYNS